MQTKRSVLAAPLWCLLLAVSGDAAVDNRHQATEGATLATLPIELTRRGAVIEAGVDGRGPFRLIVDSGAEVTYLSHEIVGSLGDDVEVIRSAESIADRDARKKATIQLKTITLGNLTLEGVPAVVVDLSTIFGESDTPDGLLGFPVFADYLLSLDLPGERLHVLGGSLPPADGKTVLEYTLEEVEGVPGKFPAIRILLDGRMLRARLDVTGSGEIMLPIGFKGELSLANEPGRMAMARTPDGDFDIFGATLDGKAMVGSHGLERPKVRFSELYKDASLGTDILNRFALTFDQVNRRVLLEQPADYRDPLHEKAAHIKPVSGKGDDLRTAFNKNNEKVQLLMILSPT